MQQRATQQARNNFARSVTQGVNKGKSAYGKSQAAAQKTAQQAANTMKQQRNNAHGQAIQMQTRMNNQANSMQAMYARHQASVNAHAQKTAVSLGAAQQKHQAGVQAHAQRGCNISEYSYSEAADAATASVCHG